MKKYEVEVNGETFIVSLKEISNEEAAQKLAAAPTPAPSAPVKKRKLRQHLLQQGTVKWCLLLWQGLYYRSIKMSVMQ